MAFTVPTTGFDFNSSLSPSERESAAKYFVGSEVATETLWEKAGELDVSIADAYTSDLDFSSTLGLDSSQFLGGLAGSDPGWTFITAPEDVSYDIANNAQRVDIFGTNRPPVVAGSRGMIDLNLGNALVEGFTRGVTVEGKIAALQNLMNYSLNSSEGFVSVPVYQVWANKKSYGSSNGGYFIIKDVRVKETMRDLKGNATRALVDISLMEVPEYQVNSGRDQASEPTAGVKSALISDEDIRKIQKEEAAKAAKEAEKNKDTKSQKAADKQAEQGVGTTKPKEGAGVPNQGNTQGGNQGGRGNGDSPKPFSQLKQEGF